jgi:hypothetical protein
MTAIVRKPDTLEKLKILSADAQYDLTANVAVTANGSIR